jgi:hypothetical protein
VDDVEEEEEIGNNEGSPRIITEREKVREKGEQAVIGVGEREREKGAWK